MNSNNVQTSEYRYVRTENELNKIQTSEDNT